MLRTGHGKIVASGVAAVIGTTVGGFIAAARASALAVESRVAAPETVFATGRLNERGMLLPNPLEM